MDSKKIENWQDLEEYGFNFLTGERCNLGMRILVDVDERGARIISHMLDMDVREGSQWNNGVASIMIPRNWFFELAAFALADEGYETVVIHPTGDTYRHAHVMGCSNDEWDTELSALYSKHYGNQRVFRTYDAHPHRGLNNVHAMSGR